jgi:hypothetical protein
MACELALHVFHAFRRSATDEIHHNLRQFNLYTVCLVTHCSLTNVSPKELNAAA